MRMTGLDEQLKDSDPARGFEDADLAPRVQAMWARVQAGQPARPPQRRWRVALPLIAVAVLATGGAIAVPMTIVSGTHASIRRELCAPVMLIHGRNGRLQHPRVVA